MSLELNKGMENHLFVHFLLKMQYVLIIIDIKKL